MRIVELFLMMILVVPCMAQEEKQPAITTNAEYLAAIEKVIEDFYGGTAYLGNDSIWQLTRVKAEKLLEIDERIQGGAISEEIRNAVFMARTLDLIVLAVADARFKPFTNTKLTPIEELPGLLKRHTSLDLPMAKEADVKGLVGRVANAGSFSWQRYEQVRATTGTHEGWKNLLKQEVGKDAAITPFLDKANCDPFWQFHNFAVGFPGVSDNFPDFWREGETRVGADLGKISEGPFKIAIELQSSVFFQKFTVTDDGFDALHFQVEADQGALGMSLGSIRRVDWENGIDEVRKGHITLSPSTNRGVVTFHLTRTELPEIEKFSKSSSGTIYIWAGDSDVVPEELREKKADVVIRSDGSIKKAE